MEQTQASERLFRVGRGNWSAFEDSIDWVMKSAETWAEALKGIERPWLRWNVDHEWSIVQQKLVSGAGWTPVIGFDPRVGPPPAVGDSIVVNFNDQLNLPVLYPHFVLEFVFAFCDRLAFWHSDLLLTESDMATYANLFSELHDGELAAVPSPCGWRYLTAGKKRRYWELLGCTTRSASRSQFDHGCGWWMHFYDHPNFTCDIAKGFHWEYGCGIEYWKKRFSGQVIDISMKKLAYGHFTRIGRKSYVATEKNNIFRNLGKDLSRNYSLKDCTNELNISHLLPAKVA